MDKAAKSSLNETPANSTVSMYDRIPKVFAGHFAGFRSTVPDIRTAHQLAGVPLGESQVIEIGCGDGRDAQTAFVPNSESYVGYDPSEGLLDLARARFPGADPSKVRFQPGYAQTTEYPEDTDIAMSVCSILHVPAADLSPAFERVREGLRPGGILYLITKTEQRDNTETYHDDFTDDEGNHVTGEREFYHHSPDTLSEAAKKAGMTVVHNVITPVETKPWDWLQFGAVKS